MNWNLSCRQCAEDMLPLFVNAVSSVGMYTVCQKLTWTSQALLAWTSVYILVLVLLLFLLKHVLQFCKNCTKWWVFFFLFKSNHFYYFQRHQICQWNISIWWNDATRRNVVSRGRMFQYKHIASYMWWTASHHKVHGKLFWSILTKQV